MLSVVFGNDVVKVRAAAQALVASTGATSVTRIEAETAEPSVLLEALGATSLFGEALTFIIEYPKTNEAFDEVLTAALPELKSAPHHFIIIEGPLLAAQKKRYALADPLEEYSAKAPEGFNTFALAEMVALRKKREAWTLLQEAKVAGLSAEEIIGTLWWQLKTMRLAAKTKSAAEAGVKDYPYQKAKRALNVFPAEMLEVKSAALLALYHEGHRGVVAIDEALEAWILEL